MELIDFYEKKTKLTIPFPHQAKSKFDLFPFKPSIVLTTNFTGKYSTTRNHDLMKLFRKNITENIQHFQATYRSQASCGILASAFNSFPIVNNDNFLSHQSKQNSNIEILSNSSNSILIQALTDAVRRPLPVVAAVEHYIKKSLVDARYIGIHWRYDDDDWSGHCRMKKIKPKYQEICDFLPLIKAVDIAAGVKTIYEQTLKKARYHSLPVPVYVAMPSTLNDFGQDVMNELIKMNNDFVRPTIPLKSFLSKNYKTCWRKNKWTNIGEILSLSEMELMHKSSWFFYSKGTTWSRNVRSLRTVMKKETKLNEFGLTTEWSIFDLALVEMKKRNLI